MTKEKIDFYKTLLLKEKGEIEGQIKDEYKVPDFGHDLPFPEEKSDEAEAFANQVALAEDLKKRLDDIEAALQKIELGGYGICEKCNKEIEEDILDIDPESRLCKDCK